MKKVILYAPEKYWKLPKENRAGGCGPGKAGDIIIPDSIWFLNIKPACSIHDFMYSKTSGARDLDHKEYADRVFLNNMLRLIEAGSGFKPLRWLRRWRAMSYYSAVRDYGGPSFWKDKNRTVDLGEVTA